MPLYCGRNTDQPTSIWKGFRPVKSILKGKKCIWPDVFKDVGIYSIDCGGSHFAAVLNDGTLWTAGRNASKQLCRECEDGTETEPNFGQVPGVNNAVQVSCGDHCTMILRSNGEVWAGGSNYGGMLGHPTSGLAYRGDFSRVEAIENGIHICCHSNANGSIVLADGRVMTAGHGLYGELCRETESWTTNMMGFVPNVNNAVKTFHAYDLTLMMRGDGSIWGGGKVGNLFAGFPFANTSGTSTDGIYFTNFGKVDALKNVKDIATSGGSNDLALIVLNKNGTVGTVGNNESGELCRYSGPRGSGLTESLTMLSGIDNAVQVTCGSAGYSRGAGTGIVRADGTLWVAGSNACGELFCNVPRRIIRDAGSNYATNFCRVPDLTNVRSAHFGPYFGLVVLHDGTILTSGYNVLGQLGRAAVSGTTEQPNIGRIPSFNLF